MARDFTVASSQYLGTETEPVTGVPVTVSLWFNADTNGSEWTLLLIENNVTSQYFYLGAQASGAGSNIVFLTADGSGSAFAETSTGYSTGVWNHACGVSGAANSRAAYLNGGGKGTNTTSRTPSGLTRMRVGGFGSSPDMDGKIAEVAVWNVALTDDEVLMLSLGFSPLLIRPGNLISYWPIIGRTSPEIDIVGGNALTVNGSAPVSAHPRVFMPRRRQLKTAQGGAFSIVAGAGAYTLTGQNASLEHSRTMVAGGGSYLLTGQDAALRKGVRLGADAGSYQLTGQDVTFPTNRRLHADPGSYLITGSDAALKPGFKLAPDSGSYVITGQDVTFTKTIRLNAEAGSYLISGQDAAFSLTRVLAADAGAYTITGQAATLIYTPLAGGATSRQAGMIVNPGTLQGRF